MCISKHHVVCLKYIDFLFMSPNSVKLGEKTGRFWVCEDGVFSPGGRCLPWPGDWAAESLLGAQREPERSEGCTGDLCGRRNEQARLGEVTAQTVLHNWIRNLGLIQRHCKS